MATAKKTKNSAAKKGKADSEPKLERHQLSERYGPKMDEDELQGLALDIKQHGQHEPIIMFEGKVLAGWNRYRGCLIAGKEPIKRDMPADSNPTAVAFGTNFLRRKLSSIQKAFYGAQFVLDTNQKQTDVAKLMACNLNRLNQCCQLLKMNTPEAAKAVEQLRDSADMGSAQFDELMLELGIARQPKAPAPARVAAKGNGALGDDEDPLDGELDVDDLTGGQIDDLLDSDDLPEGDETSPDPAKRKPKGGPVGDDDPIPPVGGKRTSMVNPHETPVSRVAKAFRGLSEAEQRQFVKFTWAKLRVALDAAIGGADVEYAPPEVIKADPSRIARNRKPEDPLDDGAPSPKGSTKKKAAGKSTKKAAKPDKPTPAKKSKGGKHAQAHDEDI